jgi:hypothetical protein
VNGIDNQVLESFVDWHKSSLGRKYSEAMDAYMKNPQANKNPVKPLNAKIINGWGESSIIVSRQKALMSFLLTALVYTDNKTGRPLKLQDTSIEAAVEQLAPAQMQMWVDQMTEIYGSMDTDDLIGITNFMNSKEFQEYQSRVTLGYRQARAELGK